MCRSMHTDIEKAHIVHSSSPMVIYAASVNTCANTAEKKTVQQSQESLRSFMLSRLSSSLYSIRVNFCHRALCLFSSVPIVT